MSDHQEEEKADVMYNKNPRGRIKQLRQQWIDRDGRIKLSLQEFEQQKQDDNKGIIKSREVVDRNLKESYDSLLEVVKALLQLDDGRTKLSRTDASVLQTLDKCIAEFEESAKFSGKQIDALGALAKGCMIKGDETSVLCKQAASWVKRLQIEKEGVLAHRETLCEMMESCQRQIVHCYSAKAREIQMNRTVMDSILDSLHDVGLADRLTSQEEQSAFQREMARKIREPRKALKKHDNNRENCGKLVRFITSIQSEVQSAQPQIDTASKGFYTECERMVAASKSVSRIWTGLIRVKDNICAPNFRTTRDNSLRAVLQLLKDDDTRVEGSYPRAREVEEEIYREIDGKLGAGAVDKLKAPIKVELSKFSVEW
ncbi:hypothetical protein QBC33DRAFT_599804 [Phialemonium atrogriseum]|uniref:Uncharacterized protein n=1 Tax=Phialemonium atrogriseum TaxID=1093897 RepID=A0AAJ0FGZ8_9PEZI|nr:uncharacterized protein QBC33DRAFT_599804 [Phialemonium atrogriseum]KAK1762868.1 hypothetical protein QBC33DRAFT_599804 [Phialemonium atrogriseum]